MRTSKRSQRSGSVMVEFTLSLTFLIPLFLGAWSFGYTFFQYSQLENAVRSGARYAAMRTYDSATSTPSSSFSTAVKKMTVYGDPSADTSTATPKVTGLTTDNVVLTVAFSSGAPSTVTVAITNFTVRAYTQTVNLTNHPYVWFPYVGYFAPP